jgi:hypothetical protein
MTSENNNVPDPKTAKSKDVIRFWASQGLSTRSIAAKCGMTHDDFLSRLDAEQNGIKPLRLIYEHSRAEYEADLRIAQNAIKATTESEKLKYTIIKDQLVEMREQNGKAQIATETTDQYVGYEIVIRPKANVAEDKPKEE